MAILVYILICLLWGSGWLAVKIGLSEAPPLTIAAARFVVAIVVMAGIVAYRREKAPKRPGELWALGYPGIYMYGLSYALIYFGMRHVNSGLASVLFASYPFFVAAFAAMRFRTERITGTAWFGMIAGFLGVLLISYDSLSISGNLFLGVLLVLAGSGVSAWGIIVHKRTCAHYPITVAATVQMVFGGLLLVIGALLFEDWQSVRINPASVGSIIYLAIPGTVVTFLGYYWLLQRIKVTTLSLMAFITPLVALLLGLAVAGEALTLLMTLGTALILGGVLLVVRRGQ